MRLKYERQLRGWSQADLGERADLDQRVVSAIEVGRWRPTRPQLARLAAALDIDPPSALLEPVVLTMVGRAEVAR